MYQNIGHYRWAINTLMPTQTFVIHLSLKGACRKQETGGVMNPKLDSISTQSNPYVLKSIEIIK